MGFILMTLLKSTISLSFEPRVELKAQFNILDTVDSTNNYAMARISDGLAHNGEAWYTHEQTHGRGQMGKSWISGRAENLLMSIIIKPQSSVFGNMFHFNALISTIVRDFIQNLVPEPVFIKWPNDIYISDRKAGGMLIENRFQGKEWNWSVIGLGINVNQKKFDTHFQAASLYTLSNQNFDPETLARSLHEELLACLFSKVVPDLEETLTRYNNHLYKKNEKVNLLIHGINHMCKIIGVCDEGMLKIEVDGKINKVRNGEVVWQNFET
jgi:BirA family biotin operon repressor/biotin-[acetyl-CoA-carboxylase] ligase